MSETIVIVDDEVHIRSLIEQTLEDLEDSHGIEILTAVNGQEGFDLIKRVRPALVFLDVMMPLINGYDVCRQITNDDELGHVRVVLLTAKGQEADRERGLSVGASEYMTKPFDPDELLDYAKSVLELS